MSDCARCKASVRARVAARFDDGHVELLCNLHAFEAAPTHVQTIEWAKRRCMVPLDASRSVREVVP